MSLRRFQNFSLGALNANRLNELVDAIARLEANVGGMRSASEPARSTILARIKGEGRYTRQSECENRVECCAYPFDEVFLRTSGEGLLGEATCVQYEVPPDAISSDRQAHLLVMEPLPVPRDGQVMVAHLASVGISGNERQMIYVGAPAMASVTVGIYTILASSGNGIYSVRKDGDQSAPILQMENLYETSTYYGALDPPQNPCADLEARRLRSGDRVLGAPIGERIVTCAPTSFTVTCVDCGTNPGGALEGNFTQSGGESAAASMMLGG